MSSTKQEVAPQLSRTFDASTVLFLLAALLFLYNFLFLPPFVPIAPNENGDSLLYLAPGQRMYQGEVMYRDFFEFVTPGTALVYYFLFRLFGLRLWIPDLLDLFLGIGLVWVGVVIAKKLVRPSLALLPSAIFLVGAREYLCDPVHHWYSLLAVMAAIAVLIERRTPARIAAAGVLCGLSACFTQTRGLTAVIGFGVYLWWESRQRRECWRGLLRRQALLGVSFLATLVAVNGYFIWRAGPGRFLWCTVVFVLKYYPKEADWNTFQVFKDNLPPLVPLRGFFRYGIESWLFVYAVIPVIFIVFLVRYWRQSRNTSVEFWERPMLVAIVGFFMFLSIAPAPNPNRMVVSELPALILMAWLIDSQRKLARRLAAVLAVGVVLVAFHAVTRRRPNPKWTLTTPQGKLAVIDDLYYQKYSWIQQHTRPSEFFYQADFSDEYFYLDLRNPTPIPRLVNNGYTTAEQVAEVIRGLEQHHVRYVCWTPDLDVTPRWENPSDAHVGPLRDYVHNNYRVVAVFANRDKVWQRKD